MEQVKLLFVPRDVLSRNILLQLKDKLPFHYEYNQYEDHFKFPAEDEDVVDQLEADFQRVLDEYDIDGYFDSISADYDIFEGKNMKNKKHFLAEQYERLFDKPLISESQFIPVSSIGVGRHYLAVDPMDPSPSAESAEEVEIVNVTKDQSGEYEVDVKTETGNDTWYLSKNDNVFLRNSPMTEYSDEQPINDEVDGYQDGNFTMTRSVAIDIIRKFMYMDKTGQTTERALEILDEDDVYDVQAVLEAAADSELEEIIFDILDY